MGPVTTGPNLATRSSPARDRALVATGLLAHLRRARDHIDREYRSAIDLDEVAAVAGVSKYHFARAFAATYGETPIRYLTRRRIERAQDLLRSANLTVTEICMAVGFASLGSFSSRFTELVGETPTAYRNRWAALGGPHIPGCYLFMSGALDPKVTGENHSAGGGGGGPGARLRNLGEAPGKPAGLASSA